MMTKYEVAKQILADNNLPPKQVDNLEILERQVLDLALKLYLTRAKNLDAISLEDAKDSVRKLAEAVRGAGLFMLVVGADIHNFRMATLRRYLDVPPEMQLDDIIARLATRDCDTAHNDAIGDVVYGKIENTEKGKEEGKEEKPPHTPLKEKGKKKGKKAPPPPPARGRARVSEAVLKKWKIEPLFVQYWSEEIDNDSIKDPDKHIKNCWTHRGSDKSWQEYKRLHPAVTPPKEEKHYNLLGEVR